jgi:hypothetical protein
MDREEAVMDANEINRQVAERVMGWRLSGGGNLWRDKKGVFHFASGDNMDGIGAYEDWNPAGNWAHFGMVLGRIMETRQYFYVSFEHTAAQWRSWVDQGITRSGETPLEAACRAILEAWDDGQHNE